MAWILEQFFCSRIERENMLLSVDRDKGFGVFSLKNLVDPDRDFLLGVVRDRIRVLGINWRHPFGKTDGELLFIRFSRRW